MSDERSQHSHLKTLRSLIAETQPPSTRFGSEIIFFADAFAQTSGHNRLEQIGLRWSQVLTPAQKQVLETDDGMAVFFASHLHRCLMEHLLPSETEMRSLAKPAAGEWTMALRMGIQGVLRRRALLSGQAPVGAQYKPPSEDFFQSLLPVIGRAAEEFFRAPLQSAGTPQRRGGTIRYST